MESGTISTSTARRRSHTGFEAMEMGIFRKKKKEEKKVHFSGEDIEKLMVLLGHVKLTSVEDKDAKKLRDMLENKRAKEKEILEQWKRVMKRGERVYRIQDVGLNFRELADAIKYDNEGRLIRGKDIYAIVGITGDEVYAGWGEGSEGLTGNKPKYPYTGNGFTVTDNGALIPELYLKRSYEPFAIVVGKMRSDGTQESGHAWVFEKEK